jgi:hypothetical protein
MRFVLDEDVDVALATLVGESRRDPDSVSE